MITGVYQIRNVINGKIYLGSTSRRFSQRKAEHFKNLRKGLHKNRHLQNAWNKYGSKNFVFEIIEVCDKEKCVEREQHYLCTLHPQYNHRPNAASNLGCKWNDNQWKKCLPKKGRESFFFSGEFFKFRNLISGEEVTLPKFEFSEKYSIDPSHVTKICNGKVKTAKKWICVEKVEVQNV